MIKYYNSSFSKNSIRLLETEIDVDSNNFVPRIKEFPKMKFYYLEFLKLPESLNKKIN